MEVNAFDAEGQQHLEGSHNGHLSINLFTPSLLGLTLWIRACFLELRVFLEDSGQCFDFSLFALSLLMKVSFLKSLG